MEEKALTPKLIEGAAMKLINMGSDKAILYIREIMKAFEGIIDKDAGMLMMQLARKYRKDEVAFMCALTAYGLALGVLVNEHFEIVDGAIRRK